jgi:putative hemolysin
MVTLVIGELAPKRLALQRAERWGLLAARPLAGLAAVASPAVWLLSRATDVVVRLAGGDPARHRPDVTEEEIRDMVAAQPSYTSEQRQIIDGALEVASRTLRQVLMPRSLVVALPADLPVNEALQKLVATGHSRAPVYTRDLDDADRVVSVLGLVGRTGVAGDHALQAPILPESLNAVTALRELQSARQQMALIVSEYGAVEGIVTVEDIVEELVGEIYDEHDRDVGAVVHASDGTMLLPGTFPVHDLVDLGLPQPVSGEVTVAGMVAERLGRIPARGDRVEVDGVIYEVQEMRRHAATRIRITPADPPPDATPPVTAGD